MKNNITLIIAIDVVWYILSIFSGKLLPFSANRFQLATLYWPKNKQYNIYKFKQTLLNYSAIHLLCLCFYLIFDTSYHFYKQSKTW